MFKPSSGRKVESGVWEHFVYEAADDKSRCCVHTVAGVERRWKLRVWHATCRKNSDKSLKKLKSMQT